ncbi:MAG: tetratricopeptide repeat protein [Reichenbachiella sp.]|uniref:tetratricopeptide repeat protein n=1 Tax=Reichenbachiella sp. TaxID=2184521 RepID=UPI0029672C5D|nr:tetratricopeptide repeat protein [Reichenbachiella sp.]MDW3208330.1 tetratricopeptide repeat protein [Reichenbachiella sp.]
MKHLLNTYFSAILLACVALLNCCSQQSKMENAKPTDHQKLWVDSLNSISFEMRSRQKDSSFLLAKIALAKSQELGYSVGISEASLNLGMYFLNRDSLQTAYNLLDKCHHDFIEIKDEFHLAVSKWYLAKFYYRKGESEKAETLYLQSAQLFKQLGKDKFHFFVKNGLAGLMKKQDRYADALKIYEELLSLSQGFPISQGGRYHSYNNIASIFIHLGRNQEALTYITRAIEEAKLHDHPPIEGYRLASTIHYSLGNKDSANYYIRKCLRLAKERQIPSFIAASYFKLADYSEMDGNIELATKYLRNGIELIQNSQSVTEMFMAQNRLADLYKSIGHVDSALIFYNKAFNTAERSKLQDLKRFIAEKLIKEYENLGKIDSAFKYLKQTVTMNQAAFDEKMAQQFARYNSDIATLEKEKDLQEALVEKVRAENHRIIAIISGVALVSILGLIIFKSRKEHQIKNELHTAEKKSLKIELDRNKQLLSSQTLSMIHKNNGFAEIVEGLKLDNRSDTKIKKIIDVNMALEKDWNNFNLYFSQVHAGFFERLKSNHTNLTTYDIRLCALVKLGLTNKEISTLLNVKYESITMSKYRLKKKFELVGDEDVNSYIIGI